MSISGRRKNTSKKAGEEKEKEKGTEKATKKRWRDRNKETQGRDRQERGERPDNEKTKE